jgi:hypothetical protein
MYLAQYPTTANPNRHSRTPLIHKPHQPSPLSQALGHDGALRPTIHKGLDGDFVYFGVDVEHVDVAEDLGDVLLGELEVFVHVLLVDAGLEQALVLGVGGVAG